MEFDLFEHFGAAGQKPEVRMGGFHYLSYSNVVFSSSVFCS